MPPRTTAASVISEEHDRRISELERHMLTIAGKQADIAAQQRTHEEVCGERYKGLAEDIAELKSDLKDMGSAMADIAKKMTERVGSSRAVREVVAYVIAIASLIAGLYSGGLVHSGH
jgi:septal ring factor EnvC (AmiA/AmiB activator)